MICRVHCKMKMESSFLKMKRKHHDKYKTEHFLLSFFLPLSTSHGVFFMLLFLRHGNAALHRPHSASR